MVLQSRFASVADGRPAASLAVGVLALQGGFSEHLQLLRIAADVVRASAPAGCRPLGAFEALEVRSPAELARCDALIIPGGESTTISLMAARSGLLEPLREFVKVRGKPTWGTCAGLILLSEEVNATAKGGQQLIGGLGVRVHRNHFGRQTESFETTLDLPFLAGSATSTSFPGVFIRAPVVEEVLSGAAINVLAVLPGRADRVKAGVSQAAPLNGSGDIVAVRQGNVLGTSFHPELTTDPRIHVWWLQDILRLQA